MDWSVRKRWVYRYNLQPGRNAGKRPRHLCHIGGTIKFSMEAPHMDTKKGSQLPSQIAGRHHGPISASNIRYAVPLPSSCQILPIALVLHHEHDEYITSRGPEVLRG